MTIAFQEYDISHTFGLIRRIVIILFFIEALLIEKICCFGQLFKIDDFDTLPY
jgi:hypothetical protein